MVIFSFIEPSPAAGLAGVKIELLFWRFHAPLSVHVVDSGCLDSVCWQLCRGLSVASPGPGAAYLRRPGAMRGAVVCQCRPAAERGLVQLAQKFLLDEIGRAHV